MERHLRDTDSRSNDLMATIVLDTLEYATRLKTGGFSEQQAETQARALADVLEK